MRIIKYIFLLLVLIFVAVAVFVATEKGDFDITKTKVIHSPRTVVFNYVNDYSNWQNWWQNPGTDFTYTNVTAGKGASFSWNGSDSGSMQTISVKENDSIHQKMEMNGMPGEVFWTFKDTTGGTKVTWRVKGKIGFMPKVYTALKGGANRVIGVKYETSLAKLDKTLDNEINSYKIKIDGITQKSGNFYLYQSITSTVENMPKNMRIMMSKLVYFFKKNKIPMYGKPFISYDYYDKAKGISKFSVCIPVKDEVFIAPGSDIMAGKSDEFHSLKTTLFGDYSHMDEAWNKAYDYIAKNNLSKNDGNAVEVYTTTKDDIKSPSKWVTEIYIPIKADAVVPETNATTAPTEKPANPKPETPTEEISIP
ncbi:MAG TPA: GyrI-like domain-containing protein [Flavobacterium sp.]|nr:GyrI-like domain-containing protein [Flavobacterium sp.]